jgi:mannose-6-phosphate isomerase-like protein (cupin superfamily)
MEQRATRPIVLRPGEGRSIDLGNFAMSLKADEATTGGAFSLLEAGEPADFGPPMHIHHNAAEAFYVLEGEYRIFIEDEEWSCPAGSFIFIPLGQLLAGPIADEIGVDETLYLAAGIVTLSVVAMLATPDVRHLQRREAVDTP